MLVSKNIVYKIGVKFDKYYTMGYKQEYDLLLNTSNKKEYFLNIDKNCWAFDIKLTDSLVATNTVDNSALRQNIIYMQLNLKQLFSFDQIYKFDERKQ